MEWETPQVTTLVIALLAVIAAILLVGFTVAGYEYLKRRKSTKKSKPKASIKNSCTTCGRSLMPLYAVNLYCTDCYRVKEAA